jgi:hypothetical protein
MNPFGAPLRRFLQARGFVYRGSFHKFLLERRLLVSVSFPPVRNAFDAGDVLGYSIALEVFYPLSTRFFLISPGELRNFRRDGTLRHMAYISESSAIFKKDEGLIVQQLLSQHFDHWYEKLTDPQFALSVLSALRTRTPFPSFVKYLEAFVAISDEEKLEFARRQIPPVALFDGGTNFLAFVAYLNAAGRFAEAVELIEKALVGTYFEGIRHARVTLDATLSKVLDDARERKVSVSQVIDVELARLGVAAT